MSYDDTQAPVSTTDDFPMALAGNAKIQAQGQLPNGFDLDGFTAPSPSGEPWTQETLAQTAFRFTPLYIPNLTPIFNTDGGLNAAALVVNALGVLCVLKTWLEQAEFDFIELKLNDVTVDQHTVSKDEADNGLDIVLFIESSRLIDQANNKIQVFVTNLAGTTDQTKAFNILVDAKAPVGRDPIVSTPYNENMARVRFADPTIEAFGIITDENAIAGVRMLIEPYPLDKSVPAVHHIKEGDVIHLSIGGVIIKHTVSASEATGSLPISIWAYFGTWQAVGAGEFIVEYFVVDLVGNHSPGFSPPHIIQSQIGGNTEPLLPAVFVVESDYDPDKDADFIDLKTFDGDATIEVLIRTYGYVNGDRIQVTLRGLSADGVNVETTVERTVTQPNAIRLEIPLDRAFIEPLVGGRLLINYKRMRAGVPDRPSRSALLNVQGDPVSTLLPPPAVQGLVDGALPVPTNPVRVLVRHYLGQNSSDRVDLVIVGYPTSGSPSYATYTDIAGTGDIEFLLDWAFFAPLVGGTFTAHYVINGGTVRPPSESTSVQVGSVAQTLLPPTTLQAVFPDFTFDPGTHMGNLNAQVPPQAAIVENSTVTFYAVGTQPNGSWTSAPFLVTSNWLGTALPFNIPRVNVVANLNHSLRLYYIVQPPAPGSTPLPSQSLIVKVGMALDLPPPIVVEATSITPTLARLNPAHVPNVVTLRVKYEPMLASDSVQLVISGKPGIGMPTIPSKPGVADPGEDYISFSVPSGWVAAYLGESSNVSYTVTRDHNATESDRLTLDVEALSEQTLDLVSVPEASGGVIDTSKAANVRIDAWPFFKQGQPVFIHLQGTTDHTLRPWTQVSAGEFTARRTENSIPHAYLQGLDNGSELTIHASVSLDETGMESSAVKLKTVQYRVARKSQVVKYIAVGANPHLMAITPNSKLLFVLNGSSSVSVIDTSTQQVIKTIPTTQCYGICTSNDGTRLFIGRLSSSTVGIVWTYSTSTLESTAISNLYDHYVNRIAINAADNKLYVAGYSTSFAHSIAVLPVPGSTITKKISAPGQVVDLFSTPEKSFGYAKIAGSNAFRILDFNGDTLTTNTPVFSSVPNQAAFDSLRPRAYITTDNNLEILNTNSNMLAGRLSGFTRAWGIACIPGRSLACVTDIGTHTVTFIDTSTDTLTKVSTLDEFSTPTFALASPDGKHVYVSNGGSHNIAVIEV